MHARSVSAAAIDGTTGELIKQRLVPDTALIIDWVRALPGPAAVAHEAGPTGSGLARALRAAGIRREVAAPSEIARPSGDRVKTDARDAVLLARLLRLEDLTAVRVPTVTQEAARDARWSRCGRPRAAPHAHSATGHARTSTNEVLPEQPALAAPGHALWTADLTYQPSWRRTSAATRPPSARPAAAACTAPMTLPMSFIPDAPVRVTTSATMATRSASSSCAGR
ncbi:MAG: family transposase [Modestobacter sp.]|nr:family transposase [Modestobacter sp.]